MADAWTTSREPSDRRRSRKSAGSKKRLTFLAASAVVAPFLGFLGTLLGIAEAIAPIANLRADYEAALFATDMSRALIPVTVGVAVALPVLVASFYFKSRLRHHVTSVDLAAHALLQTFGDMERRGD